VYYPSWLSDCSERLAVCNVPRIRETWWNLVGLCDVGMVTRLPTKIFGASFRRLFGAGI
jgi:hypothetical protein